jgi:hypothetical protein
MTSARREDVEIAGSGQLRWFAIPGGPKRGFCEGCGSSLFWDAPERETLTIAAGTLDPPTKLSTRGHIYCAQASDYEVIADDGLPRHSGAAPPNEVVPPSS